ncbi:hypothetical protein [Leptothrix discophora]|uniref:Uncharacterized protein n=1 Tax=Leptothrix discophora TaxID=89 RepID=A0ABT9G3C5_LEPDI|nr:hypothetical protein [Leptothrix discophora]MDP4300997.1 hypothetical protein [Leptothrix discophora]
MTGLGIDQIRDLIRDHGIDHRKRMLGGLPDIHRIHIALSSRPQPRQQTASHSIVLDDRIGCNGKRIRLLG